mgnify:CR=1 FL=1
MGDGHYWLSSCDLFLGSLWTNRCFIECICRPANQTWISGKLSSCHRSSISNHLTPPSIIIFAPICYWVWLKMEKQPSSPFKMGLGLLLALGYLWIAYGLSDLSVTFKSKYQLAYWVCTCCIHWGELCLSPIGLSLFNKLSPLRFASLLMAVWFLGSAGGNKMAGVLSALYPWKAANCFVPGIPDE